MSTIHRFRPAVFGIVAVLTFAVSAPIAVSAQEEGVVDEQLLAAEEQIPALAPAIPSWDETSGYGSVEASRAAASALLAPEAGLSWAETSGYASVERTRSELSALLSGELISGQEQAAALAAAAATAWDETSGYGSVEASRAARASRGALPALTAAPALSDVSATTQTPQLFTVTGSGFTAGGRVYLTIYDQMSAQLYRTRWISASALVPVVAGPTGHEAALVRSGTFREAFANLCGVTAMMRAYDLSTATWSTWLPVQPTCDGSNMLIPMG